MNNSDGRVRMVARRFLQTALVIFALMTLTFVLLRFMPGGPFETETSMPPEVQRQLEVRYHVNESVWNQYVVYIKTLGTGDLGDSYANPEDNVADILRAHFPVTLKVGISALILSFLLGLPWGLYAARHHRQLGDRIAMMLAAAGVSLPVFLVGPVLILLFSFYLDWLPPGLVQTPAGYILPVVTLALKPAALVARLVKASALEVVHSDFIRTARATGVSERRIFSKHVLKNSLIPVLGISGPLAANILSGSFVVELIFALPGLGHHYIESVTNRDYPLILALTLVFAVTLSFANLCCDLLSMATDPRVRVS